MSTDESIRCQNLHLGLKEKRYLYLLSIHSNTHTHTCTHAPFPCVYVAPSLIHPSRKLEFSDFFWFSPTCRPSWLVFGFEPLFRLSLCLPVLGNSPGHIYLFQVGPVGTTVSMSVCGSPLASTSGKVTKCLSSMAR